MVETYPSAIWPGPRDAVSCGETETIDPSAEETGATEVPGPNVTVTGKSGSAPAMTDKTTARVKTIPGIPIAKINVSMLTADQDPRRHELRRYSENMNQNSPAQRKNKDKRPKLLMAIAVTEVN